MQRGYKGSQLKLVSSPKLVYKFIVEKVLGGSGRSSVSDVLDAELLVFESDAGAGGGAQETMTFTGLLATDTIMAMTQKTAGANGGAPIAYSGQAADALDVDWDADPGAGAVLTLMVRRS